MVYPQALPVPRPLPSPYLIELQHHINAVLHTNLASGVTLRPVLKDQSSQKRAFFFCKARCCHISLSSRICGYTHNMSIHHTELLASHAYSVVTLNMSEVVGKKPFARTSHGYNMYPTGDKS